LETTHKCGPSGPVSVSVPSVVSCVKEVKAVVDRQSLGSLSNDQMVNTATPGLYLRPLASEGRWSCRWSCCARGGEDPARWRREEEVRKGCQLLRRESMSAQTRENRHDTAIRMRWAQVVQSAVRMCKLVAAQGVAAGVANLSLQLFGSYMRPPPRPHRALQREGGCCCGEGWGRKACKKDATLSRTVVNFRF